MVMSYVAESVASEMTWFATVGLWYQRRGVSQLEVASGDGESSG